MNAKLYFAGLALLAAISSVGAASTGTGFAIAPRYVMTAYHVIDGGQNLSVRFGEGEQPWINAEYVDGNVEDDWCILKIDRDAPCVARLNLEKLPTQGDDVYTYGYPIPSVMGAEVKFNRGNISALVENKRLIQHSVPTTNGNSGGPLCSYDDHKVVGLHVMGLKVELAQNAKYAVSLYYLKPSITKYMSSDSKMAEKRSDYANAVCLVKSDGERTNGGTVSRNDANTKTYQLARDKVATIKGSAGMGTGFLCEMNGVKYLVTNRHVANQRGKITALFQDGRRLSFALESPMEMAVNRDLVRFRMKTDQDCLKVAEDVPNIGEEVEFYGNAGGKGVITVTTGKILAVGQENVEIDSQIQGGNSGSPLIRVSDGKVVGVTTMSTFNRIDGDPSKVGTRYDPNVKLTREFAVRFTGVEWQAMSYGKFLKWVNMREDLYRFVFVVIENVCFKKKLMVYKSDLPDLRFNGMKQLNDQLRKIAECDEKLKKARDRYREMVLRNQATKSGAIGTKTKTDFDFAIKGIKDRTFESFRIRTIVISRVLSMVKGALLTEEERKELSDHLDGRLRDYTEQNRMQLKGLDLPNIPSNPYGE